MAKTLNANQTLKVDRPFIQPIYLVTLSDFSAFYHSLLHLNGADESTTIIDEYGHTWYVDGNAKLDTADKVFGTASLELDGTGDQVWRYKTSLGSKFTVEGRFHTDNAALGTNQIIWSAFNGSGFGIFLAVGGDGKIWMYASSNGTTWDICGAGPGITAIASNTWYKWVVDFDGTHYRVFVGTSGALTLELDVTSSALICPVVYEALGAFLSLTWCLDGGIDEFRGTYGSNRYGATATAEAAEFSTELFFQFSDRNIRYLGIDFEDYLFDLSALGCEIQNLGGYNNAQIVLRFKNAKIRDKNYLIELFDDYPPEKKYVEIYKLLIDTGETFSSDVSTKIFKGEMGQPYEIDELGFSIACSSMLFGKNASLPLDVIDTADFPSADPDDVGKYRNIIYGNLKKVVCPWTVAGWVSTLTADITAAATSIVVSDSVNAPAVPFTAIIDNEEVRVTVNTTATGTLTVTRAYGGTTAYIHNKGAQIYEKRSDFQAEVAQHPVKSIGDVYVRRGSSEWLRVISGVTKYINTGGRAYLVFSDKPKFEEKTNQASALALEPHAHTITPPPQYSTKKCIPTSAAGGTNPGNTIDGNNDSYGSFNNNAITASFTETNLGTINKQYVYVDANAGEVRCPEGTTLGTISGASGLRRFVKIGGSWGDAVVCGLTSGTGSIAEMWKEIEYTPGPPTADDKTLTPSLSGNSVANMVIGDLVACDVEGYQDDGSGTYTGTPSALIERPDHVRKHILIALLGFVAGDIGASFATVGTTYAGRISGGYKLAFVTHEVATKTMDLFERIDLQTRSNMFESGGKFELAFGSTADPPSEITFDTNNTRGHFIFSKTEVADIKNKIRGHYFRDYSKAGEPGEIFQKVNEKSDATSITKYGQMQEDMEFPCIGDLSLMVDDVLDWILLQKKELKKIVSFEVFWDAMILENCDYFTVTSAFWSGLKFKTILLLEKPESQIIEIEGLQFVAS